jgi:hypothetical protein
MKPRCRHCRNPKVNRPRGLCYSCHRKPEVRDLYPSTSKYARRGASAGGGTGALPATPTYANPGTEGKLAEMERRARAGNSLFHPDDCELGDL